MTTSRATLERLKAKARVEATRNPAARVIATRPTAAAGDATDAETGAAAATAELWLYGTVGGYWWGFDSDSVADALRDLGDVDDILVRLHSFGGSAIEGIAIANLLANHPATIRVVIDGLAASAASMIALAGSELIMSPGSQLMIHDAWLYTAGNAAELRAEADWIDKQSQNYAETYAHRAGGTAAEWRERMTANNGAGTWYSAAEAVETGIAARVENIASSTPPPPTPDMVDLEDEDATLSAAARYDLEVLLHPAARAALSTWRGKRAPKPPTASADGSSTHPAQKESAMAFTPEQLTTMRQELGLAENADEATIVAALAEALAEQAEAPANPTTPVAPEGFSLIDNATLDTLRAGAQDGHAARTQQLTDHRDRTIANAINTGKIPPARKGHYEAAWKGDPVGTEELLAALAPGLVPVAEMGHDTPAAGETTAVVADDALDAYAASMGLTKEDLR